MRFAALSNFDQRNADNTVIISPIENGIASNAQVARDGSGPLFGNKMPIPKKLDRISVALKFNVASPQQTRSLKTIVSLWALPCKRRLT